MQHHQRRDQRAGKREDLLAATETEFDKIVRQVERRRKRPLTPPKPGSMAFT